MRQGTFPSEPPSFRRPGRHGPALAALLGLLALASCSAPAGESTPDAATTAPTVQAQGVNDFIPLNKVAVPTPTKVLAGGVDYNNPTQLAAAIRLGKALFWDQQAGEYKDVNRPLAGQTDVNGEPEYATVTGAACASCHFAAGADNRTDGGVLRPTSVGVIASKLRAQQQDGDMLCEPGGGLQRTGANTPPAVGAIYNRLQFWDGRAHHLFNGHNPFGNTGSETGDFPGGVFQDNSSLASQADGPANNPVEMTCDGQTWQTLGAKLIGRKPLGKQVVAQNDSVFAGRVTGGKLNYAAYRDMIDETFPGLYPNDAAKINAFGMIWGQTIQAYERTLRPDQTPFDKYLAGNRSAMSDLAAKGFDIFKGKGGCTNCHSNTEMSDATVSFAKQFGVLRDDGGTQGFHNIGITDENADPGRQNFSGLAQDRGTHKTAQLRNVGLTAPYMHDGSLKTLDEVIDFYANGGKSVFGKPTAGANNPHLDDKQKPISLGTDDRRALREFLQNGLTDPRVARDAAPFDHPSLGFNDGSPTLCATDTNGNKTCP